MTEENKNEISTEMEINSEDTKVELSEEEMGEINGGVNMGVIFGGNRRNRNRNNNSTVNLRNIFEQASKGPRYQTATGNYSNVPQYPGQNPS